MKDNEMDIKMLKNKDCYDLTNIELNDDKTITLYEDFWDEDDQDYEAREVITLSFDDFFQWLESEEE